MNLGGSFQLLWEWRLLCWGSSARSLLIHWNISAQSTFSGKRQVKGQRQCSRAVEYGGKASWGKMKQMCQNPSKARQARRVKSAPKNKAVLFFHSLYTKRRCCQREEGWGAPYWGEAERRKGRLWHSAHELANGSRQEHGLLLLPALLCDFAFPEGTPSHIQLIPCSLWERWVGMYVATRWKGSTLLFSLLLAKIAKRVVHSFWGKKKKTSQNTRDLTKLDSVTVFKNIFIDAFQVIKCKKKKRCSFLKKIVESSMIYVTKF